jgi:hypothetical protein
MPDGSINCPQYGGNWKTVQTPSILLSTINEYT